ncbi:MAG: hypothetical protein RIR11_1441 [Bacteroidota bacterium]|jgi:hypothetical protein
MTNSTEIQFIDKIDCKFPYHDRQESLQLIEQAAALSPNALYSIIEELCRIPHSKRSSVATETLVDLLAITANQLNHPLKELIVDTADKMIRSQELTVEDVILKMQIVQKYPGQFAALSILYFSCDDKDGKMEPIWKNIISEWNYHA